MLASQPREDRAPALAARLRSITEDFEVPADHVRRITHLFVEHLNDGLTQDGADMGQIPSYVTRLPNGTERGVCLAIDLGGTNLRVCIVELHGNSTYTVYQSRVVIPPSLMVAPTYTALFAFIAQHTKTFLETRHKNILDDWLDMASKKEEDNEDGRRRHLQRIGFTFSFAFAQHALNKGTLLYWTKGFDIPDAVGRDPCAMLQDALDALELPLIVTALVNDTVGTLATRAYTSPGLSTALLGAIFGTGTNGAYLESMSKITKLHGRPEFSATLPDAQMALNTEWGGFDDALAVLPITVYDAAVDRASVNPGSQHFEKRISGLYLGEILRRTVVDLVQSQPPLLAMTVPPDSCLYMPGGIDSAFLSAVAHDTGSDLGPTKDEVARVLGARDVSTADAHAVRTLAITIGRRAARLAAVAIAGVVLQSGRLTSQALAPADRTWFTRCLTFMSRFCSGMLGLAIRACRWLGVPTPLSLSSSSPATMRVLAVAGNAHTHIDAATTPIEIGVDGSLIEHFPGFKQYLREALREIPEIGPCGEQRLRIESAADGSVVGAALIAHACLP